MASGRGGALWVLWNNQGFPPKPKLFRRKALAFRVKSSVPFLRSRAFGDWYSALCWNTRLWLGVTAVVMLVGLQWAFWGGGDGGFKKFTKDSKKSTPPLTNNPPMPKTPPLPEETQPPDPPNPKGL